MSDAKGIPYVREQLTHIALKIENKAAPSAFRSEIVDEIRALIPHLRRNLTKTRARRISRPMDGTLVQSILLTISARPNASDREIGELFNVNGARVCEVRQGKHDDKLPKEVRDTLHRTRDVVETLQLNLPKIRNVA